VREREREGGREMHIYMHIHRERERGREGEREESSMLRYAGSYGPQDVAHMLLACLTIKRLAACTHTQTRTHTHTVVCCGIRSPMDRRTSLTCCCPADTCG
jgi:hypothetical protein